jgi:multidrug efflux system membrane fusion protein
MFHAVRQPFKLAIYSLMTLILVGCEKTTIDPPLGRLVEVQEFKYTEHKPSPAYPGRLTARYESKLAFQVDGRLIDRLVEVGNQVSKGETIATLDSKDYDLVSDSLFNQKREAEADYLRAKKDLQRARQLRENNFIGEAGLDHAINEEAASKAILNALQAQHAKSLNERNYTQLRSPANGIITTINAEIGDLLTPRQNVAILAWDDNREFITALPEDKINYLSVGQSVNIRFWALPNDKIVGVVREISPVVDPDSQTYAVKMSLEAPPPTLKLGMSGYAAFAGESEQVGLIPTTSLLGSKDPRQNKVQVIVVDSDTGLTRRQIVTLGISVGDQISITTGLEENDLVVVAGAHKVKLGESVRILEKAL